MARGRFIRLARKYGHTRIRKSARGDEVRGRWRPVTLPPVYSSTDIPEFLQILVKHDRVTGTFVLPNRYSFARFLPSVRAEIVLVGTILTVIRITCIAAIFARLNASRNGFRSNIDRAKSALRVPLGREIKNGIRGRVTLCSIRVFHLPSRGGDLGLPR